ncbi:MAG TPA: hypothetical protein VGR26_16750 [Acidimicrobiales bacterium]|nr:hypothetical protein [Acidimicrobiales bacterium]
MRQRPETPAELFEVMQFSPIDWPWKTTRMRRDSVQNVRQRPGSSQAAIGELYHQNSTLFPACLDDLAASWLDPDAVRLEFLRRRASGVRPNAYADGARFSLARPLLDQVVRSGPAQLFYAIELRLSDDSGLVRYEPLAGRLEALRFFSGQEAEPLREALDPFGPPGPQPAERLFILASFPRNEVLYGARGYRRTLVEVGRVVQAVVDEARRREVVVRVSLEFHDRVVDAFIGADGVEEAALAVVELGERT